MSSTTLPQSPALRQDVAADSRLTRALQLLDVNAVQPAEQGIYYVHSLTDDGTLYTVDVASGRCDCPDYRTRQRPCKHLEAVRLMRWEQRVAQLCTMHGISLAELKGRIERNVVENGCGTVAQREAVEAICRIWDRQREAGR